MLLFIKIYNLIWVGVKFTHSKKHLMKKFPLIYIYIYLLNEISKTTLLAGHSVLSYLESLAAMN